MDAHIFSDLSLEELYSRLVEAREALHKLNIGARAVSIRHNDTQTQFSDTQVSELRAYINALSGAILAREQGTSGRHEPIYLGLG